MPRICEQSSDIDTLRPLRVQQRTFPTVPSLIFTRFYTLTNTVSFDVLDSRAGFVNNLSMSMLSPPSENNFHAHSPGFVRSQISYHVLDSRPGFVNNRPMSMPSPPLETTSPTHSPGSLSPRSLSPNQSRQGGAQRTRWIRYLLYVIASYSRNKKISESPKIPCFAALESDSKLTKY